MNINSYIDIIKRLIYACLIYEKKSCLFYAYTIFEKLISIYNTHFSK